MPKPFFSTDMGNLFVGDASRLIRNPIFLRGYESKCDLIFFSPPYSLVKQKSYKNKTSDEYVRWLKSFAKPLARLLSPTGSIIIELGNAWEKDSPTMSTTATEALLAFKKKADLFLCQEFIWHNPARLPSPAQWVTVERFRLKDSFTKIWWMAKTDRPKADNRRVLQSYSASMKKLLETKSYNAGLRPSEHRISKESFFINNGGAIPAAALDERGLQSFLRYSNTRTDKLYREHCQRVGVPQHPARMPADLAAFFISLTTDEGDLVMDPFAGSNTTGATAEKLGRHWVSVELSHAYAKGSTIRFGSLDDHEGGAAPAQLSEMVSEMSGGKA